MADKVAVVTGSNKGLGYAIVQELCSRGVGTVYVCSRDVTRGKEAIEKLNASGCHPKFYQLEVTDKDSVKKFAEHLKKEHGGLDILINNAAIINADYNKTDYEESVRIINTNYRSLVLIIQKYMFPILKDNARVINISSDSGHLSNLENTDWIQRLTRKDIILEDVNAFVDWFLDSVKNGTLNEKDFKGMNLLAYRVSKIAVCALTRVQQKEMGRNISLNSIHPGFIQTDMTKNMGELTMEQAAVAPVYLALDIDQSVKGRYFWFDKSEKDWADAKAELHVNREEMKKFMNEINFYG